LGVKSLRNSEYWQFFDGERINLLEGMAEEGRVLNLHPEKNARYL
jgi:hypothetical protein